MKITHPKVRPGQKVVIVAGGGFAGLRAAKVLAKDPGVYVVLIDQRNHHLFQPLLYQVAAASLDPADIAVPIRSLFDGFDNVAIHLAKIESVDLNNRSVIFPNGVQLEYDYLILACGAYHSYFGKPQWEEFAPGLKTLDQAIEIRRRILSAFEIAENELDLEKQRALLNFVIVGGGPTGVELAGAISDIARTVLLKNFRRINPESARVIVVESAPRILKAFPEDLSARAHADLRKMGIEVRTSARVEQIDDSGVQVGDERIPSKTVIWAAGVQAPPISKTLGVELDRSGRVKVGPDLSIPGHPEVFVVGDLVHFELDGGGLLPGLASAAMQTGLKAAENILCDIHGQSWTPFKYHDKGVMATIGKKKAIAQAGKIKLTGFIAWLAWFFVHLFYMTGFGNKVMVFTKLAWCYVFSKRGARVMMNEGWRLDAPTTAQETIQHRASLPKAELRS